MRTQRTKALLAAVGAFLLAAVGVLLAPGAASAAPDYPPPPADLALSSGTVRAGNSVGVYGQGFGAKEPVIIVIKVRPRSGFWFPRQGFVTHKQKVWTNKDGEFKTRVPTYVAGTATILAHGLDSGEDEKAKLKVLGRNMGPGGYGHWYDHGAPSAPGGLPGMQAVDNTVGRWLDGHRPGYGVSWRPW